MRTRGGAAAVGRRCSTRAAASTHKSVPLAKRPPSIRGGPYDDPPGPPPNNNTHTHTLQAQKRRILQDVIANINMKHGDGALMSLGDKPLNV